MGSSFIISDQSISREHGPLVFRRLAGILPTAAEAPDARPPLLQALRMVTHFSERNPPSGL